ncbi:MAG: hypothetical protein M3H12_04365 [Chromatiales bacterium]
MDEIIIINVFWLVDTSANKASAYSSSWAMQIASALHVNNAATGNKSCSNVYHISILLVKRTLISVLTGSHYYRSMQGMLMIVDVIDALSWEAFFLANDTQLSDDLMQLRVLMGKKNAEVASTKFKVLALVQPLLIKYNTFLSECQVKSEMAAFNFNIKKMVDLLKCLTTSDPDDVTVYSAIPDGQLQLCRTRYEAGAVHPAGIKEPWRHRRPD